MTKDELQQLEQYRAAKSAGRLTDEGIQYLRTLEQRQRLERDMSHRTDPAKEARMRLQRMGIGPLDVPGIAAGRGMMNTFQGAKQLGLNVGEMAGAVAPGTADEYTRGVNEDIARYQGDVQTGYPWAVAPEMAGNVVSTGGVAPGLVRPLAAVPSALRGLAYGSAQGISQFDPTNTAQGKLRQSLFGGIGGAVGDVAPQLVARTLSGLGRESGAALPPPPAGSSGRMPPITNRTDPATGLPLTRGQETGNVVDQRYEQRLLAGMEGPDVADEATNFLNAQRGAVGERLGTVQNKADPSIPSGTVPQRVMAGVGPLREGAKELNDKVDQAFDYMRNNKVDIELADAEGLVDSVIQRLPPEAVHDPTGLPNVADWMGKARQFVTPENLPPGTTRVTVGADAIHMLRKFASNRVGKGTRSEDRVLRQVVENIDEELAGLVGQGKVAGDPAAVSALQDGIKYRAKYGHLYSPRRGRYKSGDKKPDPAGKVLQRVIEDKEVSGDKVTELIFGSTSPSANPFGNTHTLEVLRRVQEANGHDGPVFTALKGAAMERFKLAVTGPDGLISPERFTTAWRKANEQNSALIERLLTAQEHRELAKLNSYAARLIPKQMATNRSGTGYMNSANLTAALETLMTSAGAMGASDSIGAVVGGAATGMFAMQLGQRLQSILRKELTRPVFERAPGFGLAGPGAAAGQEGRERLEDSVGVVNPLQ